LNSKANRPIGEPIGHLGEHPRSNKIWPTPPLLYRHVGVRVLLLMRLDGDQLRLKAVEVPDERFEWLLFCRVAVHRRACYSDRMQRLEAGELDGQAGRTNVVSSKQVPA
jgi:hypothetical protein